jgi:ABC-type sugar transport system permease subunit
MLLETVFHLQKVDWIKDSHWIKPALIIQATWRWSGFIALFFIAAMRAIPRTYYDVARIEGSRPWQTFYSVTFPMIKHIILFAAIFLLLDAFVFFEGAYALLGSSGGTADAGLLLISYVKYKESLFQYNLATAASLFSAPFIMLAIAIVMFKRNPAND